jgi:hypothetical protein
MLKLQQRFLHQTMDCSDQDLDLRRTFLQLVALCVSHPSTERPDPDGSVTNTPSFRSTSVDVTLFKPISHNDLKEFCLGSLWEFRGNVRRQLWEDALFTIFGVRYDAPTPTQQTVPNACNVRSLTIRDRGGITASRLRGHSPDGSESRTTQLDPDFSFTILGDANKETDSTIDIVLDYLEAVAESKFRQTVGKDVVLNLVCSSSVLASFIKKVSFGHARWNTWLTDCCSSAVRRKTASKDPP